MGEADLTESEGDNAMVSILGLDTGAEQSRDKSLLALLTEPGSEAILDSLLRESLGDLLTGVTGVRALTVSSLLAASCCLASSMAAAAELGG